MTHFLSRLAAHLGTALHDLSASLRGDPARTERELIARINERLALRGEELRRVDNCKAALALGEFFVWHDGRKVIVRRRVVLEELAAELGVV